MQFKKVSVVSLLLFASIAAHPQCWKTISGRVSHTLAIGIDGSLWACGGNSEGQLGLGTFSAPVDSFFQVGTDLDWKTVSAGNFFATALKQNNTLWAWGDNYFGMVGDGTTVNRNTPVQIGTDSNWESTSSGQYHTMAIKKNGSLWCWGRCANGVGNAPHETYIVPTQIGTDTNWLQVSVGACFTIALKKDHTLWGWGSNNFGQVGNGNNYFAFSPEQIGTDTNWATIATGLYHSLAIKSDGSLWTWGEGAYGRLGNGTTNNSLVPTRVGTDNDWRTIAGGTKHSLALKSDGSLWGCGQNDYGELGDGTRIQRNNFVRIGSDTNWRYIVASNTLSKCLKTDNTLWATGYGYFGNGLINTINTYALIRSFIVNQWVGGTSNLWNDPQNWSCKCVPDQYTRVLINQGAVYLNMDAEVMSLKLNPPATLTIDAGKRLKILR